ncbi:MAG: (Fe-S)-binding protein, partial [Candidatus Latescibacteria bacterium]|nr:(Fe-S)-binding protein [Candidatus Latescibacterota bacterium]
ITFRRMVKTVMRGKGKLNLEELPGRLVSGFLALITQGGILRRRPLASIFHLFLAWAFFFYILVNLVDLMEGYVPTFRLPFDNHYRLLADFFSTTALIGITFFLIRRFIARSGDLTHNETVKLHPNARSGIARDSLLVGVFILGHVGFRFLGESVSIALEGADPYQPLTGLISSLWIGYPNSTLIFAKHACWWLALGLILFFLPYFPYTKHAHLFMGPLNWMTRPQRKSPGALEPIDFEDQSLEQFGVARLTDLSRTQIVDAFACIMCNRCQDVCPAYLTGKELSPSALEINKRYHLQQNLKSLANGNEDEALLLDYAISDSAVWSCLSCGACTEACPVGNEPMLDILDIRRDQVLMQSRFPSELKDAYTGIERNANPWQMSQDRLAWSQSLDFAVPTVEQNPNFDVLFWVGCAGAFDASAQNTTRALVSLLHAANVNFAVLGNNEACTGDLARRSGNEYLFYEMAKTNIETLNSAGADKKQILTSCPHCMHTLRNEYPAYGGAYTVEHHTTFINDLIKTNRLKPKGDMSETTTFHDPCYLGRHNGEYDSPRDTLTKSGHSLVEMNQNKNNSFCCGGGGAQAWKEEEEGSQAVSTVRYDQAKATNAETVAVGCPFCARMLKDANAKSGENLKVKDIAEIVAERL